MGRESRTNPFSRDTISTLPRIVRDMHGRELVEGDVVIVESVQPNDRRRQFQITRIRVVDDPQAPQNLMEIDLLCRLRFRCPRDLPNEEFLRVLTAAETLQPSGQSGVGPEPQGLAPAEGMGEAAGRPASEIIRPGAHQSSEEEERQP